MRKTMILLSFLALAPFAKGQLLLEVLDAPDVPNITLPAGITIDNGQMIIASIFDSDYLPYSAPTSIASWNTATNIVADGQPDKIIDIQGKITTTGIIVHIPVKSTGSGTVPAYKAYVNIPAERTEDGQTRVLELSWIDQTFNTNTKTITATIKAIGGDLNVKKLDLKGGLGSDYKGLELGTFVMPQSAIDGNLPTNYKGKYELRVISGIPDKNIANKTILDGVDKGYLHQFIYLPIQGPDGKLWLNNNLGADYNNINSSHFNPVQQAESFNDYKAYGSLFQWGKDADGRELINWTSSNTGTYVEEEYDYYTNRPYVRDNDPCPIGWITPSYADYDNLIKMLNTNGEYLNTYWSKGAMKFPTAFAGKRSGTTEFIGVNIGIGRYWTRQESLTLSERPVVKPTAMVLYRQEGNYRKRYEMAHLASKAYIEFIRCIYEGDSDD